MAPRPEPRSSSAADQVSAGGAPHALERETRRLAELERLLALAHARGPRALSAEELALLLRLYRHAATVVARLATSGTDPAAVERARRAAARAHAFLFQRLEHRPGLVARVLAFFLVECPRTIRAQWRVLGLSFGLLYGFALLSWFAVGHDLELAYSLLDPRTVDAEIRQIYATAEGEPFRGNFTFGLGQSPNTAGWIMTHNMGAGLLFFGAGLVPPLFLLFLAINGLMLGTYTAVAGHFDQAGEISSILWCHGTLELQALVLAGAAGLVLARAWVAPGPWTRRHAMTLESARAWRLLAPVFPLLFLAGLIEAFVSPHAPLGLRLSTAIVTGTALVAWVLLCGRGGAHAHASGAAQ